MPLPAPCCVRLFAEFQATKAPAAPQATPFGIILPFYHPNVKPSVRKNASPRYKAGKEEKEKIRFCQILDKVVKTCYTILGGKKQKHLAVSCVLQDGETPKQKAGCRSGFPDFCGKAVKVFFAIKHLFTL